MVSYECPNTKIMSSITSLSSLPTLTLSRFIIKVISNIMCIAYTRNQSLGLHKLFNIVFKRKEIRKQHADYLN